ncbi:DUF4838 domain-containing protein [bacterium AH-315-I18]|nr:DUF4838 domain-containing protein [bacterium AH-315-I18]
MERKNWMFAMWVLGFSSLCPAWAADATSGKTLRVFDQGQSNVYLDLDNNQARNLQLTQTVADFTRCVAVMTGKALPRTAKVKNSSSSQRALFNPTQSQPTRFECRIVKLEDTSNAMSANARVSLIASTNSNFSKNPFAEAGEKVAWHCVWNQLGKTLDFNLDVANVPYYGPGYGPFIFGKLQVKAPDFNKDSSIRMLLEMRGGQKGNLRGGYIIDDQPAVYTQWFDPSKAGVDTTNPGVSDKKGSQAWTASWQKTWENKTAFYVAGYHAKGRVSTASLEDIYVTRGGKKVFSGQASDEEMENAELGPWRLCPTKGTAMVQYGTLSLKPAPGGWNRVMLQAMQVGNSGSKRGATSGLIPLRLELKKYPVGANPYGVSPRDVSLMQGFSIQADDKAIVLRACTEVGLGNALYYMLDYWGCRWVMPGKMGECIPKHASLTFPRGVTNFSPRNHASFDRQSRRWGRRNMLRWKYGISAQHYWFYALPPKTHFKTHPKWYSLIAGKREPRQLCTSNPEVIAAMTEAGKKYLRKYPQATSFPMDPQDNPDFCQCAPCVALDPPGNITFHGDEVVTDRVFIFANAVAKGIAEEFPNRYVALLAYMTHLKPPVNVRPADNVIVGLARSSGYCLLHLVPQEGCNTSQFEKMIEAWSVLTPNLYLYEYDPISWTGALPSPLYMEMMKFNKRIFKNERVRASFSDLTSTNRDASTYINAYLAMRMKIDPSKDPDAVLRDMCEAFFGPAAKLMEQYYRELAKVTDFTHLGHAGVSFGLAFYHEMFDPKRVHAARGLLDQAIAMNPEKSIYQDRIHMVDMSQRYLEAYLSGVWYSQANKYSQAVASFDLMDQLIDEMAEAKFLRAGDTKHRAKTMRLKSLANYFPKKMGFFTNWQLLGPFDNSDRNAARNREPFEPVQSITGSATLANGTTATWRNYTSPGGFLSLEKALTSVKNKPRVSYLFAGTTYYAQKTVRARLKMDSFNPFVVYVNGKQVYSRLGVDADCPDKRQVDVTMNKGKNTIVFKLCQLKVRPDSFPWGLYARIVPDGANTVAPPAKWSFKTDSQDVGTKNNWHAVDFDDSQWEKITVPEAWESTIGPYDGYAWYRTKIKIPAQFQGKSMVLNFEGVDEQAWVYFNGTYLGERTTASTKKRINDIWNQPFKLRVSSDRLVYGKENLLVVRVHDSKYAGGIYLPVRLNIAQ